MLRSYACHAHELELDAVHLHFAWILSVTGHHRERTQLHKWLEKKEPGGLGSMDARTDAATGFRSSVRSQFGSIHGESAKSPYKVTPFM